MLAIIGGSGLGALANFEVTHRQIVRTPYGDPSAPLALGNVAGVQVLFLARHGYGHTIPPHEVNYRANLWALRELGAKEVVSVSSVGGIRAAFAPGEIVIPDQLLDYTWGRKATYFEAGAPVTHVDFTEPYSRALRARILAAAKACGERVFDGGVYAAVQGPRLETAAEVNRLERDGADLVGMTGMPEAVLAREIDLEYAAIAVVGNHAAGRAGSRKGIEMEKVEDVLRRTMDRVRRIIEELAKR
ncbi:MAG: S-methyl-5'-thioinosine phosphorylase [Betaproteobacteria bacterium]|nr:S-methyl-5'-thioinosine phosphorylase [Betaproteobacteria bacterium]MBI2961281.1 S-methyl-5'-thioinosine phosphorylase [Betaproteobacteria bacterium]